MGVSTIRIPNIDSIEETLNKQALSLNTKLEGKICAEGDPFPAFLQFFYNNEVGKEAREARAGSLVPTFLLKI